VSELEALEAAALAEIELERVVGRPADAIRNPSPAADEGAAETPLDPEIEEDKP
jgi:hypothetical protein